MKKKKENEQKAKLYQEYRKSELIKKNIADLLDTKKKEKDDLINDTNDTNNSVLSLDEQIKKLEDKLKEHSQKADEYIEQVGTPMQDLQFTNIPLD